MIAMRARKGDVFLRAHDATAVILAPLEVNVTVIDGVGVNEFLRVMLDGTPMLGIYLLNILIQL